MPQKLKRGSFRDGFGGNVYGFLEAVSLADDREGIFARSQFVFDAVLPRIENGQLNERESEFALVRLMSTRARIEKLLGSSLTEGRWYRLTLEKRDNEPLAWIFAEENGVLTLPFRTNLAELAIATPESGEIDAIREYCKGNAIRSSELLQHPAFSSHADGYIRVVDVGQASFCAIHESRDPDAAILGYFDVGAPLPFHRKSFPPNFLEKERLPKSGGFVALSHWDFDHYSAAISHLPELQELAWYAPDQEVGAFAAKFKQKLGSRLVLLDTPSFGLTPNLKLWKGTGPADDRNASGYVLHQSSKTRKVLIAGDVPYSHVPQHAKKALSALAITHHGGPSHDVPPNTKVHGAIAAVSYGSPNYYRHPNTAFLTGHIKAGWSIAPTRPTGAPRQDVWLA